MKTVIKKLLKAVLKRAAIKHLNIKECKCPPQIHRHSKECAVDAEYTDINVDDFDSPSPH